MDTSCTQVVHLVLFSQLDDDLIWSVSLHVEENAGPSGIDSHGWKRICLSFNKSPQDPCNSVVLTARHLCSILVDTNNTELPVSLQVF